MANGEILEALQGRISTELNRKRLTAQYKSQLELMQLFVIFLQEDHPKVVTMWNVFKPISWGMGIAVATLIGLAVSGRIEIVIK